MIAPIDNKKFVAEIVGTHNHMLHVEGAPQDVSLPVLQELLGEGYTTVQWETNPGATDAECLVLNGDTWPLEEFVSGLQHAAPLYEKSHGGCGCTVVVKGDGKDDVRVSAFGRQ